MMGKLLFLALIVGSSLIAKADDGQWTMATKDYANSRFSELDQINVGNAKQLKLSWKFSTGVFRGQEAAPLVVGDTMYVVTPFPNYLYALDLKKPGTLKWKYDPKAEAASKGEACCDWVNRGAAYADGRIFYNTLDAHTVCVDAASGKEIWKTRIGDINVGETITMAPMVVKGKVYVGISGGEFGVRGRLTCLNTSDGKIKWRAYSTGPDADCLIGPRFHPYYQSDQGKDLGVKTWPPGHWKIGGGTIWGFLSYDPETNLLFYGTGNPRELEPGLAAWGQQVVVRLLRA